MIANKSLITGISELLKVIAHPERLNILILLSDHSKRLSVKNIQERLDLTQPETSRHLTALKNKGILCSIKSGTHTFYYLNPEKNIVECIVSCLNVESNI